jgi:hypothetical protein
MPSVTAGELLLTDEEIICAWMDERATHAWVLKRQGGKPIPIVDLTLIAVREVEARLTEEQWSGYITTIQGEPPWTSTRDDFDNNRCKSLLHADAPTRIKALAAILRVGMKE